MTTNVSIYRIIRYVIFNVLLTMANFNHRLSLNMTDNEKNTRTLIVSFVLAMMIMVPLRFVEATQQTLDASNRILGEMTAAPVQVVRKEVVPVVKNDGVLEAPYNKLESKKVCISVEQAEKKIYAIVKRNGGDLSKLNQAQSLAAYEQISKVDKDTCK